MLDTTNPCNGYKETTVSSNSGGGGSSLNLSLQVELPGKKAIPSDLKDYCQKYCGSELDWRWMIALAWVESKWNFRAVNKGTGARGWFQFMPRTDWYTYQERYQKGPQTKKAVEMFKAAMETGRKGGLQSEVDQCLFAAISHNAGPTAASKLLKAGNKTISDMNRALFNSYAQGEGYKDVTAQNKEKAQFAIKVQKSYNDICANNQK